MTEQRLPRPPYQSSGIDCTSPHLCLHRVVVVDGAWAVLQMRAEILGLVVPNVVQLSLQRRLKISLWWVESRVGSGCDEMPSAVMPEPVRSLYVCYPMKPTYSFW